MPPRKGHKRQVVHTVMTAVGSPIVRVRDWHGDQRPPPLLAPNMIA